LSPADTDRRATWERTGQEVAELTDGLGMHIDPGIRDAVTALRLLGLRTEASCEGHDSWGVGAPWVSIGAHPTPELTIAFVSLSRSRLQSLGAEFQVTLPVELRIPKLAAYQREMADFTTFLRQRYLAD
jgi:hypothetical protein